MTFYSILVSHHPVNIECSQWFVYLEPRCWRDLPRPAMLWHIRLNMTESKYDTRWSMRKRTQTSSLWDPQGFEGQFPGSYHASRQYWQHECESHSWPLNRWVSLWEETVGVEGYLPHHRRFHSLRRETDGIDDLQEAMRLAVNMELQLRLPIQEEVLTLLNVNYSWFHSSPDHSNYRRTNTYWMNRRSYLCIRFERVDKLWRM